MFGLRVGLSWLVLGLAGCGITERQVQETPSDTGQGGASSFPSQAGKGGQTTGGYGGKVGAGGGPMMDPTCDASDNPTPLRALSAWEYRRSVLEVTGHQVTAELADAEQFGPFAVSMRLDASTVGRLLSEAEGQGAAVALDIDSGCEPLPFDDACYAKALTGPLASALRRIPSSAEVDRYMALFRIGAEASSTAAGGVELMMAGALLSPSFLFKLYWGDGMPGGTLRTRLRPSELASRLSFLLVGHGPDAELMSAAATGGLASDEGLKQQAMRLMDRGSHVQANQHFFEQWLDLGKLEHVPTPGLTPELRASMNEATQRFVEYVFTREPNLKTLLTSDVFFVDRLLAPRYGIDFDDIGFAQSVANPSYYSGVLTQASTLTTFGNPSRRGQFVRQKLLCNPVPPPPPSIDTHVTIQPGQTRRDAWLQHRNDPVCAACHQLMDGIGFGLEQFDELGQYRETEMGLPIDASGEVIGTNDIDGPFVGPAELAERLAGSPQVSECLAQYWVSYALQRDLAAGDECTIQKVGAVLATEGFPSAMLTLATSEQFRTRSQYVAVEIPVPSPPAGQADTPLARQKLLLEFTASEAALLAKVVPLEDRQVIEQYLEGLRSLEQQLAQMPPGPEPLP